MQFFQKEETREMLIALLTITLIFSYDVVNPANTFYLFPFYFLAVIVSFFFHEMAHRFTARRFGCASFFKLWPQGIVFGLLFMLVGVKFVAPGAVVVYPYSFGRWGYRIVELTATEMGLISFSGIAVNLFFAMLFKPLSGMFVLNGIDIFGSLSWLNAWWAFINLLPIPPLDGSKLMRWKPIFWFIVFLAAVLLVFL